VLWALTLVKLSSSARFGNFIGTVEFNNETLREKLLSSEIITGTSLTVRIRLHRSTLAEKTGNSGA